MNQILNPKVVSLYFLFVLVGFACAIVLPTMSLFFAKELAVRPLLVGLPYAGIAIFSIAYNQVIGHWSDGLSDRRGLIAALCVLGAGVCVVLALTKTYWLAAGAVVLGLSLAMVSFAQMLAYSLDYADAKVDPKQIPLFNAIVRAQIAIAWVAGPPCGFLLASHWGFSWMYLIAALLFLVIALLTFWVLDPLHHKQSSVNTPQSARIDSNVKWPLFLLLGAFSMMWGANNAYLIAMPLYLQYGLQVTSNWIGVVMGTCAFLEIPFMVATGYLASRVASYRLVLVAAFSAVVLYAGVYFAQTFWQVMALQLFNACFIGVLAGLGVSLVQELLPGRSGLASSFYSNTSHFGSLISSVLIAGVAEQLGYRSVFVANIIVILIAIWAFWQVNLLKTGQTNQI